MDWDEMRWGDGGGGSGGGGGGGAWLMVGL